MISVNSFKKVLIAIYQYYRRLKLMKKFPFLLNSSQKFREITDNLRPYYEQYVKKVSDPEMTCSLRTAVFLKVFCDGIKPKHILDLGSGFSSFVLRSYAASQNGVIVYSVDDSLKWLEYTRDYLASHNLPTDRLILWSQFKDGSYTHFDFIFHDLGNMDLRKRSLDLVLKLGERGAILLDDMHKLSYTKYVRNCLSHYSYNYFNLKAYSLDEFGRFSGLISDMRKRTKK